MAKAKKVANQSGRKQAGKVKNMSGMAKVDEYMREMGANPKFKMTSKGKKSPVKASVKKKVRKGKK